MRSGAPQASPISPIESDEVLLAMTAPGKCAAIGVRTRPLSGRSSGTDSTTRSQRSTASSASTTERRAAAALDRGLVAQAESPCGGERLVGARPRDIGVAREAVHAMAAERVLDCDLRAHQPGTDDDDIHERRS